MNATSSPTLPTRDQDKVWDYYQTEGLSIFDLSVPRLDYLFRQASRRVRVAQPRVLNIGMGNGWLERRCRQAGWETWSLDPNPAAAAALGDEGVRCLTAGIEAVPVEDSTFDVVFCSEVLEHLLDGLLLAGMDEIARVLRPGGHLIGTVPCREVLELKRVACPQCLHVHHAYGHHQSFDKERIVALMRGAKLVPERMATRAFPGFRWRDMKGKAKSLVWAALGRMGAQAADAKIVFIARKPGAQHQ